MKTAKQYLIDAMGYETTLSRIDLSEALAAVQAALDDAADLRRLVREGLADYFLDLLPAPKPPQSTDTLPLQVGNILFKLADPASPCSRCGKPAKTCTCEQPPF